MREHVRRGPACVADVRGQMVVVHRCGLFDRQTTPRASARYPFKLVVVVVSLVVLVALAVLVWVWVPLRRWYGRRRAYSRTPFCRGVKVVVVSLLVVVVVMVIVVIVEKVAIYVAHVDQLNIWWLRTEIEGGDFDGTYERRS